MKKVLGLGMMVLACGMVANVALADSSVTVAGQAPGSDPNSAGTPNGAADCGFTGMYPQAQYDIHGNYIQTICVAPSNGN